jgi:hypothetical protein
MTEFSKLGDNVALVHCVRKSVVKLLPGKRKDFNWTDSLLFDDAELLRFFDNYH